MFKNDGFLEIQNAIADEWNTGVETGWKSPPPKKLLEVFAKPFLLGKQPLNSRGFYGGSMYAIAL